MELRWPGKQLRKDFLNTDFSCFHNFFYPEYTFISDVIKTMNWGSNRVIKQQGFRVLPIKEGLKHIKQWERITDPYFLIKESSYISQPKGQSVVVVHIKECYERN